MKNIMKCITFDGFKFWYGNNVICDAPDELCMQSDIPKEVMDKAKLQILGKVSACEV